MTLAGALSVSPSAAAEERVEPTTLVADRAASVLDGLATEAHRARILGGYTLLGVGITFTGIGLVADLEYDKTYGSTLWAAGVGGTLGGVLSLLTPSTIENFAHDQGADAPGYSPQRLEEAWRSTVDSERSRRRTLGVIGLGCGALLIGTSGALLAGVGDMDRSERGGLVVSTGLIGGANLASGIVTLLLESELERAFALAYGAGDVSPRDVSSLRMDVGVAPVRGGGTVQMFGTF